MKKTLLAIFLLIPAAIFGACSQNSPIPFDQLPATAQAFITTHFADVPVFTCIKDSDSFDVTLNDGTELEFNRKGSWKEVDCKLNAIPSSVATLLPEAISTYITTNFNGALITAVQFDSRGYELELNNSIDLKFNSKGKFKEIDD